MNENLNQNKQQLAKKYSRIHRILSITEVVIFYVTILFLLFSGLSIRIRELSLHYTTNPYLAILIFSGIIGIAESIINFPLDFYSGYVLEHKYNLSNQNILEYFKEKLKGLVVGLLLGVPMLIAFYYILRNFGDNWWFILGIFMFFVSVILGRLAPVLIMPIFYKFKPIENDSLKQRILNLCEKTGVMIRGIYEFDMSKNTKKANAAFTGLGKSKRIIIGDTLLEKFSEDEIEVVFAHEVGHYKKKHIYKLMLSSTLLTFIGLYITSLLYGNTLSYFHFISIDDIAALPLLALFLSLYGLITTPLSNLQSRKYEWQADTFALETTQNKGAFISAMEKLADQNLADKEPNKIIEFLFHSHPSLQKRITFAKDFNIEKK
jgi:STE24 endopeptidase